MDDVVDKILLANGVYDIVCACSILWLHEVHGLGILSDLHATMFQDEAHVHHPVIRRLMAYWVLTYGVVRACAGFQRELYMVGALTYFIEAVCFEYESLVGGTVIRYKATIVSVVSLLMGGFILWRALTSSSCPTTA